MWQSPAVRSDEHASRSVAVVFGALLTLCSVFAAVVASADPAVAGEIGPHAGFSQQHVRSAGSVADEGGTKAALHRRLVCRSGNGAAEYRDHRHVRGSAKGHHATRRRAVDQPQWVEPNSCVLPTQPGWSADAPSLAERAPKHRAHRTFDGRAPPGFNTGVQHDSCRSTTMFYEV